MKWKNYCISVLVHNASPPPPLTPELVLKATSDAAQSWGRPLFTCTPLQMTVGLTDGERLYAARYASGPVVNTLYFSADMESLRQLYPAEERFAHFGPEARAVVSEPLVALPGLWHEVPAGSALTVEKGRVNLAPFTPRPPV